MKVTVNTYLGSGGWRLCWPMGRPIGPRRIPVKCDQLCMIAYTHCKSSEPLGQKEDVQMVVHKRYRTLKKWTLQG
jgi:hypothetical protein